MKSFAAPLLALLAAACMTMDGDRQTSGPASPDNMALALEAGGVRLITLATGSTRPVAFGAAGAQALAAVALTQSERGRERRDEDCGTGGPEGILVSTNWEDDGLDIVTDPATGRFIGWNVRKSGLSTMNGIGVGTTRAELERAFTVEWVPDSTLGHEFLIGGDEHGLSGLVDGAGPNARVTVMWSGTVCQHR